MKHLSGKILAILIVGLILIFNELGVNLSYSEFLIEYLLKGGFATYIEVRIIVLFINLIFLVFTVALFLIYKRNLSLFRVPIVIFIFQIFLFSFLLDLKDFRKNFELAPNSGSIAILGSAILVLSAFLLGYLYDRVNQN